MMTSKDYQEIERLTQQLRATRENLWFEENPLADSFVKPRDPSWHKDYSVQDLNPTPHGPKT
jgi:hypothetical protein